MYPYHNKIRQRIKKGELVTFAFVDRYKDIKPALLLFFATKPHVRVIRNHRFIEYYIVLKEYNMDFKMQEIQKIYTEAFSDGDELVKILFKTVFVGENVRWLEDVDEKVASFAFLLNKTLSVYGNNFPSVFLAGVATRVEKRGRGFMRELIHTIFREGYLKDIPLITLCPANERYYLSCGFRTVLRGTKKIIHTKGESSLRLEVVKTPREFLELYSDEDVFRRVDVFAKRTKLDVENTFAVYEKDQTSVYKVFDGEQYLGYFVFDREEIYEYTVDESVFEQISMLDGVTYVSYGDGESRYMARVLHPEIFLNGIPCPEAYDKTVTIVDSFMNSKVNLQLKEGDGCISAKVVDKGGDEITVEELTDWAFGVDYKKGQSILGYECLPKIKLFDKYL